MKTEWNLVPNYNRDNQLCLPIVDNKKEAYHTIVCILYRVATFIDLIKRTYTIALRPALNLVEKDLHINTRFCVPYKNPKKPIQIHYTT